MLFKVQSSNRQAVSVKQLALCGESFGMNPNKLNKFGQSLVQLEPNFVLHKTKVSLNLPELQVLASHSTNKYCRLSIDCLKLSVLLYNECQAENLLDLKYPETITKLQTNMFDQKKT